MSNFKQALASKQNLLGTFVKTPHYHVSEVLARSALDVLCLDAEHAPFDRSSLDSCVLACLAQQKPVLIRVPNDHSDTLLNALDIGATGVVVPHVKNADQLRTIVAQCYYGDQGRGYAGSTRAAGYTTHTVQENLAINRQGTVIVPQIEDIEGLRNIDDICQVEGIDCLFIGRMDLTIALGESDAKSAKVVEAVESIVATANKHQVVTGLFVADLSELPHWMSLGVSLFLLNSDHGFMLKGAAQMHQTFLQADKKAR